MRKVLLIAAVALLGIATGARAQGVPGSGRPHEHDGFFLQLDAGLGSMKSKTTFVGIDWEFSGTGGEFGLSLGGVIAPNFIVAGSLWGTSVSSPDLKVGGLSGPTTNLSFGLVGYGVALTYYFMPINIYVQATPSIGVLTANSSTSSGSTKAGFAIKLAAGKEWWVSDNWGIGFNVQYAHSSNEDKGTAAPTWSTNWFGAAFSATYN